MKIEEFVEKYKHIKKYYLYLKKYTYKQNIYIFSFDDNSAYKVKDTVMAYAIPPNKIYFRIIPPPLEDFIHELIHLCKKPHTVNEEIYSYNLTNLIIYLVDNNINFNPFFIYSLSLKDIEREIQKYNFRTIEEFYEFYGLIPYTHNIDDDNDLIARKEYDKKQLSIAFMTELIAGFRYDRIFRDILLNLLRTANAKRKMKRTKTNLKKSKIEKNRFTEKVLYIRKAYTLMR